MKTVYLRFDSGPLNGTKPAFETILKLGVRGSFFMVGVHIEKGKDNKSWLEEVSTSKHADLCNASYSYANNRYREFYCNPEKVLADFDRNQCTLGSTCLKIAALPGRNMWQIGDRSKYDIESGTSSAKLLHKSGYKVFGWDVLCDRDSCNRLVESASDIVADVEKAEHSAFTPGHIVLLMYDAVFQHPESIAILEEVIRSLQCKGYGFKLASEYPQC